MSLESAFSQKTTSKDTNFFHFADDGKKLVSLSQQHSNKQKVFVACMSVVFYEFFFLASSKND